MVASVLLNCIYLLLLWPADVESSLYLRETRKSATRRTQAAVTTTGCNAERVSPYGAMLELSYFYLVEFLPDAEQDLSGVEDAITYSVFAAVDKCDSNDRPLLQVEPDTDHEFSASGFCSSTEDNICRIVFGKTIILLEDQHLDSEAEALAYPAIIQALEEPEFLSQFTSGIGTAQFIRPVDSETTILQHDSNSSTPVLPIAAAAVSLVIVSIFLYGAIRRRILLNRNPRAPLAPGKKTTFSDLLGIQSRKRYFERMVDEDPNNFPCIEDIPPMENPSVTWSVSDLTSESGSIRSMISRTTSKLESIAEEEEEGASSDSSRGEGMMIPELPEYLYGMPPVEPLDEIYQPEKHYSESPKSETKEPISDFESPRFEYEAVYDAAELQGYRFLDYSDDTAEDEHDDSMANYDNLDRSVEVAVISPEKFVGDGSSYEDSDAAASDEDSSVFSPPRATNELAMVVYDPTSFSANQRLSGSELPPIEDPYPAEDTLEEDPDEEAETSTQDIFDESTHRWLASLLDELNNSNVSKRITM